ncbi:MAG TPA: sigma-70 family RNA polymerase sigma factor [Anseongella sp.]|nr:sigma-70 family RNA polymerase sigma factor [Anseongella sp.]
MPDIHGKKYNNELVSLLKEGDKAAFTCIYNLYWEKLYIMAYRRLHDPAVSEEIVQEVFLQLWRKRESLNIEVLAPYLSAMTRYAVYRYLASELRRKERELVWNLSKGTGTTVSTDIDHKLLMEMVTELSNQLPEKCRLVFCQSKLKDRPLKEVAADLNLSEKTVEAHLTKALKYVRLRMGKLAVLLPFFTFIADFPGIC